MTSLKTFRIEFDKSDATYFAGETITGNIIVDVDREKSVRGLKFSARGLAHAQWTETKTRSSTIRKSRIEYKTHSNSEEYFHVKFNLLGTQTGDSRITISVGYHKYPFKFHLPHNIPSSFEHGLGYVRYTVKATIDRPWKFDHECKAAFTVISPLDLNMYPHRCIGIQDDVEQCFCCLCCIDLGSAKAQIKVPTSGYVPGQAVVATVHFVNHSNSVRITKICAKLRQKLKFYGESRHNSRTDIIEIKAVRDSGPFSSRGQSTLGLNIPSIPPSNLEYCGIIDLNYQLDICIHVSGLHCKIEKSYPIIIGTIPLYYTASAPLAEAAELPIPANANAPATITVPMPMAMSVTPSAPYPAPSNLPQPNTTSNMQPPDKNGCPPYNWQIPPPSYEECMSGGTESIRDHNDSNYVHMSSEFFVPRYPVYNFPEMAKT